MRYEFLNLTVVEGDEEQETMFRADHVVSISRVADDEAVESRQGSVVMPVDGYEPFRVRNHIDQIRQQYRDLNAAYEDAIALTAATAIAAGR